MSRCNACWSNLEGDSAFIAGCHHIFCLEHATQLLEKWVSVPAVALPTLTLSNLHISRPPHCASSPPQRRALPDL